MRRHNGGLGQGIDAHADAHAAQDLGGIDMEPAQYAIDPHPGLVYLIERACRPRSATEQTWRYGWIRRARSNEMLCLQGETAMPTLCRA